MTAWIVAGRVTFTWTRLAVSDESSVKHGDVPPAVVLPELTATGALELPETSATQTWAAVSVPPELLTTSFWTNCAQVLPPQRVVGVHWV